MRPACLEDSHRSVSCAPPCVPANPQTPRGLTSRLLSGLVNVAFLGISSVPFPHSESLRRRLRGQQVPGLAKAFDSPRFRSDERTGGSCGWPTSDCQPSARLCWKLPSSSMFGARWLVQLQGCCKPCCGAGIDAGIGLAWEPKRLAGSRTSACFSVPRTSQHPTQHPRSISHSSGPWTEEG